MIRHGKSEAGFDQALDSDLSKLGHQQAAIAAASVASQLPFMKIIASPLRRARSTAEPLAKIWRCPIAVSPEITEIPTPLHLGEENLSERRPWLTAIMTQKYGSLDNKIEEWRKVLIDFSLRQSEDCLIFTHYLTINAIVGFAMRDDKVVVCDPGYCSLTEIHIGNGEIDIISVGRELVYC